MNAKLKVRIDNQLLIVFGEHPVWILSKQDKNLPYCFNVDKIRCFTTRNGKPLVLFTFQNKGVIDEILDRPITNP